MTNSDFIERALNKSHKDSAVVKSLEEK